MRLHLVLVVALALAGCTANGTVPERGVPANMSELKGALGVLPSFSPPVAKAQSNVSLAPAGSTVRFASEGSADPQGLPLVFSWDFGDGSSARGAVVEHAFAAAGEFVVRLTVSNERGLSDSAVLNLRIVDPNRAPVAVLRIVDEAGQPVSSVERGVRVVFDAGASSDDGPFNVDWDFGDGTTSHEVRVGHVYSAPGRYLVKLQVVDGDGLMSHAQALVRVSASDAKSGKFVLTEEDVSTFEFAVAAGLSRLELSLTFDGGFGANDLSLVLRDAGLREVARSREATPTGAQGPQTRVVVVDAATLAPYGPGTWRAEVVRVASSPAGVEWTLGVRQLY